MGLFRRKKGGGSGSETEGTITIDEEGGSTVAVDAVITEQAQAVMLTHLEMMKEIVMKIRNEPGYVEAQKKKTHSHGTGTNIANGVLLFFFLSFFFFQIKQNIQLPNINIITSFVPIYSLQNKKVREKYVQGVSTVAIFIRTKSGYPSGV